MSQSQRQHETMLTFLDSIGLLTGSRAGVDGIRAPHKVYLVDGTTMRCDANGRAAKDVSCFRRQGYGDTIVYLKMQESYQRTYEYLLGEYLMSRWPREAPRASGKRHFDALLETTFKYLHDPFPAGTHHPSDGVGDAVYRLLQEEYLPDGTMEKAKFDPDKGVAGDYHHAFQRACAFLESFLFSAGLPDWRAYYRHTYYTVLAMSGMGYRSGTKFIVDIPRATELSRILTGDIDSFKEVQNTGEKEPNEISEEDREEMDLPPTPTGDKGDDKEDDSEDQQSEGDDDNAEEVQESGEDEEQEGGGEQEGPEAGRELEEDQEGDEGGEQEGEEEDSEDSEDVGEGDQGEDAGEGDDNGGSGDAEPGNEEEDVSGGDEGGDSEGDSDESGGDDDVPGGDEGGDNEEDPGGAEEGKGDSDVGGEECDEGETSDEDAEGSSTDGVPDGEEAAETDTPPNSVSPESEVAEQDGHEAEDVPPQFREGVRPEYDPTDTTLSAAEQKVIDNLASGLLPDGTENPETCDAGDFQKNPYSRYANRPVESKTVLNDLVPIIDLLFPSSGRILLGKVHGDPLVATNTYPGPDIELQDPVSASQMSSLDPDERLLWEYKAITGQLDCLDTHEEAEVDADDDDCEEGDVIIVADASSSMRTVFLAPTVVQGVIGDLNHKAHQWSTFEVQMAIIYCLSRYLSAKGRRVVVYLFNEGTPLGPLNISEKQHADAFVDRFTDNGSTSYSQALCSVFAFALDEQAQEKAGLRGRPDILFLTDGADGSSRDLPKMLQGKIQPAHFPAFLMAAKKKLDARVFGVLLDSGGGMISALMGKAKMGMWGVIRAHAGFQWDEALDWWYGSLTREERVILVKERLPPQPNYLGLIADDVAIVGADTKSMDQALKKFIDMAAPWDKEIIY